MRRYLLDTGPLAAFVQGRAGAVTLIDPWLAHDEAATSIVVYGEVVEYLLGRPDRLWLHATLRDMLHDIRPIVLSYPILDRYAHLRRSLRPPYGPGLIGDIDTLIAATALEHNLTVDGDRAFFRSYDSAGKVKRLRHNPEVTMGPSTARGKPTGPAIRAVTRRLSGDEAVHARRAIIHKHPIFQGVFVSLAYRLPQYRTVYYELRPVAET